MERNLTPSTQLHFNFITDDILQIQSAKSLVRFMSACKTWYYLIKSPEFIAIHLKVNRLDVKGHKILILGEDLCYVLKDKTIIQQMELDFCMDYAGFCDTPIESCNGLILIPILPNCDREYMLWNPSIKKSKKLESKAQSPYYEKSDYVMFNHEIFGLGFHEPSNDHRVVRIRYVIDDRISGVGNVPTEVDVYSLVTDSWHIVDSSPDRLIGASRGVFINGVIHWLSATRFTQVTSIPEDDRFESILLFDFEDESFREMVLPEELNYTVDKMMTFNAFKGSLAAIVIEITTNGSMFALWVMTDYDVIDSWTKRFIVINKETHIERWPLGFLMCGILVYWEKKYRKRIIFLDVESGEAQNIEWMMDSTEVMDFMDSLVLINGCNELLSHHY